MHPHQTHPNKFCTRLDASPGLRPLHVSLVKQSETKWHTISGPNATPYLVRAPFTCACVCVHSYNLRAHKDTICLWATKENWLKCQHNGAKLTPSMGMSGEGRGGEEREGGSECHSPKSRAWHKISVCFSVSNYKRCKQAHNYKQTTLKMYLNDKTASPAVTPHPLRLPGA